MNPRGGGVIFYHSELNLWQQARFHTSQEIQFLSLKSLESD